LPSRAERNETKFSVGFVRGGAISRLIWATLVLLGIEKLRVIKCARKKTTTRDRNHFRSLWRRQNDGRQAAGARTRLAFY
jgi:hypothetical protein